MPDARFMGSAGGDDQRLRDALQALPLASPNASVLPQLQQRLAQRRRAQRPRPWLSLAAAAAVGVLALGVVLRPTPQPLADPPTSSTASEAEDATAFLIAQNQVYESALRSAAFNSRPMSARSVLAGAEIENLIGMLDLELAQTQDTEQTQALWGQRLALMQELAVLRTGDLTDQRNARLEMQPAVYRMN
jgi:hypothetical protein